MTVRCRNLDLLQLLWERSSKEGRNKEKKKRRRKKGGKRERKKEKEKKREREREDEEEDERIGKRITEDVRRLLDFNVMSAAQGHLRTSHFCHKQMHILKLLS